MRAFAESFFFASFCAVLAICNTRARLHVDVGGCVSGLDGGPARAFISAGAALWPPSAAACPPGRAPAEEGEARQPRQHHAAIGSFALHPLRAQILTDLPKLLKPQNEPAFRARSILHLHMVEHSGVAGDGADLSAVLGVSAGYAHIAANPVAWNQEAAGVDAWQGQVAALQVSRGMFPQALAAS